MVGSCQIHSLPSPDCFMQASKTKESAIVERSSGTQEFIDDDEALISALFFESIHEEPQWTFPSGKDGLTVRRLGANSVDLVGPSAILVVFSNADHFGIERSFTEGSFNISSIDEAIDAAIEEVPLHVLQVIDQKQSWYHRACEAEADPYHDVISLVEEELNSICVKPAFLATMGFCCGGYAAIRVGMNLRADRILAFSPQAYIDPTERLLRQIPPVYYDSILQSFLDAANCPPLDSLVKVLRTLPPGTRSEPVRVELHIGEDAKEDLFEMRTFLKELDQIDTTQKIDLSVSMHVHAGCGHAVPYFLRSVGKLQGIMQASLYPARSVSKTI